MILVGNCIISDDIKDIEFCCNLDACKGACCIEGDAGAPLLKSELDIISENIKDIIPYLNKESVNDIEKHGFYEYDFTGELCTRLINEKDCVFVVYEGDTAYCGIEKAFREGKLDFIKPISCHLYPIRVVDYGEFQALNYHKWEICSPALEKGKDLRLPLYKFLKEPLIRRFGDKWYKELLNQIDNK